MFEFTWHNHNKGTKNNPPAMKSCHIFLEKRRNKNSKKVSITSQDQH